MRTGRQHESQGSGEGEGGEVALLGKGGGEEGEDPAVLTSQGHGGGTAGPGDGWLLSFPPPVTLSSPPAEDPICHMGPRIADVCELEAGASSSRNMTRLMGRGNPPGSTFTSAC